MAAIQNQDVAVRAHDIVVCMERTRATEYDGLFTLGTAVRLALHLRGSPPVSYELVKDVAVHLLSFGTAEVKPAIVLLADAEFVRLTTEGNNIKTVIPDVPYFDDLYEKLGEVGASGLNEMERLTVALATRLAQSPIPTEQAFGLGAEKKAVQRTLTIGKEGGFLIGRRARGRDILLAPSYFSENPDAFADLVARSGATTVGRVIDLIRKAQGFPLALIEQQKELAGSKLTDADIAIVRTLAQEGFTPPPAISTTHAGTNFFMFGPRPGKPRLPPFKKNVYERAMVLVAAVRQGQLLAAKYRIWSPSALLNKLRSTGYLRSNSEAWEQYRQVATMGIARLSPANGGRFQLVLIDKPENKEALDMAIELVTDGNVHTSTEEEAILAFAQGHAYLESLLGRKKLVEQRVVALDEERRHEIDTLLLTSVTS